MDSLRLKLTQLRGALEPHFSEETAHGQWSGGSDGHCAACACLVWLVHAGEFVSATVDGQSHWFNRILHNGRKWDVDITADQFGFEPIRIGLAGQLYPDSRVRAYAELNDETRDRAAVLAKKAIWAR